MTSLPFGCRAGLLRPGEPSDAPAAMTGQLPGADRVPARLAGYYDRGSGWVSDARSSDVRTGTRICGTGIRRIGG